MKSLLLSAVLLLQLAAHECWNINKSEYIEFAWLSAPFSNGVDEELEYLEVFETAPKAFGCRHIKEYEMRILRPDDIRDLLAKGYSLGVEKRHMHIIVFRETSTNPQEILGVVQPYDLEETIDLIYIDNLQQ